MKRYLFILTFIPLVFWGCSASVNTTNMSPEERFDYTMKLYNNRDYESALKEFQAILLQYPGSSIIDSAQYFLGMTRYNRGEYILAAYEFSKLIKSMPSSKFIPDAQFMLADSYFQLSPYYELDQKYTKKAIEEFQSFIDIFPTDSKVADAEKKIKELNDKLAKKEYKIAYIYNRMGYYRAAEIYYDYVVDDFHDTKYGPLAMLDKIKLLVSRNKNKEALTEISKFLDRYPKDENVKEVETIKSNLDEKVSAVK